VAGEDGLQLRPLFDGPTQVSDKGVLQLRMEVRLGLLDDDRRVEGLRTEEGVRLRRREGRQIGAFG
jgi:hypothetical protein